MSKSSHSQRQHYRRIPSGGGYSLVYRMPKGAVRLPRVVELSADAQFRLKMVECGKRYGVDHAVQVFGKSRATVYRWLKRFNPHDLRRLESRSRRPKRTRTRMWSAVAAQAVLAARERHPRWGKAKLKIVLARAGIVLPESTIGRILTSLKERRLLIEPATVRSPKRQVQRPYATRVPMDKRTPVVPGALIQLDTLHVAPLPGIQRRQFTAIDVASRWGVVGVRSRATAGTASAFLAELLDRFPFPVQAIQVDGGSEFMAEFEDACHATGVALYVLPPRSPKLNGRVERLNGTTRREFWECYDGDLDLVSLSQALRQWEHEYNTSRPHQALGYDTPATFLSSLSVSHVSN